MKTRRMRRKPPTVEHYSHLWMKTVRVTCRRSTIETYEKLLRLHILPSFGDQLLRDVTRADVKALVTGRLEAGWAPKTAMQLLSVTRAMFTHAMDDAEYTGIRENPAGGVARRLRLNNGCGRQNGKPRAFSREQLQGLLRAADELNPRLAMAVFLMARTGLRIGEALALTVDMVNLAAAELTITRTIDDQLRVEELTKGGDARVVHMTPQLVCRMEDHLAWREGWLTRWYNWLGSRGITVPWVFPARNGSPLRQAQLRTFFKRALAHAGLPAHFTPHHLRHTYASLLIAEGAPIVFVQRQLGHASIKLTVDLYGSHEPLSFPNVSDRLDDSPPPLRLRPTP
jgi:integrase